jgi:transposase
LLNPEDLVLAEAERDVRELEQYLADQRIRVLTLHASGRDDDEVKAREGLLLLADALVIARRRLCAERETMLPDWTLAPVVAALQTMRGIAMVNAATLIAELGDLSRFADPRQLMAYLGLTPSEYSSGSSVRRGGITKAGNGAARRLLIEAAWSYRFPARLSRELLLRQESQPKPIRDIAWKGQVRLCARYRRLARTGKPANVVTTAIARELTGFVWAIARQVTVTPG